MVKLILMNEEQYKKVLEMMIPAYAQDKVASGDWSEEQALVLSADGYRRLLPEGLRTPGHYLYMVHGLEAGVDMGFVWLFVSRGEGESGVSAFLYEITLYELYRGQGFGKETMAAVDAAARELGASQISLHVFGHNQRALHLYQRMGYAITDYNMKKRLE